MRRITSIKNAIKYFEEGTRVETRKSNGGEYKVHIPPTSFHRLTMTYTNGITSIYEAWRWGDYAKLLREESQGVSQRCIGSKLASIRLTIDV